MKILAVVPLRLNSSRVPRKILADIAGETLAERTLGQAIRAFEHDPHVTLLAAVDDPLTRDRLRARFPGLEIRLTPPELPSGTDRVFAATQLWLAEDASRRVHLRGILNIQGDMPFAGVDGLRQAAGFYRQATDADLARFPMITLAQPWPRDMKLEDMASVKVLSDQEGGALYFSRHPIPYSRVTATPKQLKSPDFRAACDLHIGLYGYTLEALARLAAHAPIPLEIFEGLEQLRAQWLGMRILVLQTSPTAIESFRGVDTPKDLSWARAFAKAGAAPKAKTKAAGKSKLKAKAKPKMRPKKRGSR